MISKDLVKNITELRQNPLALFRLAEKKEKPLFVFHRTEPVGVVISWDSYEKLAQQARQIQDEQALKAISIYKKEKREGKLKTAQSVNELFD